MTNWGKTQITQAILEYVREQPKGKSVLEKQIEAYLVKRVKEIGGIAYKFTSPSNRGVSDRIVVLPNGGVCFVELKRAGGKLTRLQVMFAETMYAMGQRYVCLWSKEEVDRWISQL